MIESWIMLFRNFELSLEARTTRRTWTHELNAYVLCLWHSLPCCGFTYRFTLQEVEGP